MAKQHHGGLPKGLGAFHVASRLIYILLMKFPSLNFFVLLYPQTQKDKMEACLKHRIALRFQHVL